MQTQENQKFLVVDEDPQFRDLVEETFVDRDDFDLEIVDNPEEGLALINDEPWFSVICSDYNFSNSNTNGRQFLKTCQEKSPLSSRAICSSFFSNEEYLAMVKKGEVTSYVDKSLNLVSDSFLSSASLGMETYKINLFGHYLHITDFSSAQRVAESLVQLDRVRGQAEWEEKSAVLEFDFEVPMAELDKFLLAAEIVSHQASATINKTTNLLSNESIDINTQEKIKQVQGHIHHIGKSLSKSRLNLIKRIGGIYRGIEVIAKGIEQTREVDEFIKRIRVGL
jgi:CheY-like chemotaxis protein